MNEKDTIYPEKVIASGSMVVVKLYPHLAQRIPVNPSDKILEEELRTYYTLNSIPQALLHRPKLFNRGKEGYLNVERIDGKPISRLTPSENPKINVADIEAQLLSYVMSLHQAGILMSDVADNIGSEEIRVMNKADRFIVDEDNRLYDLDLNGFRSIKLLEELRKVITLHRGSMQGVVSTIETQNLFDNRQLTDAIKRLARPLREHSEKRLKENVRDYEAGKSLGGWLNTRVLHFEPADIQARANEMNFLKNMIDLRLTAQDLVSRFDSSGFKKALARLDSSNIAEFVALVKKFSQNNFHRLLNRVKTGKLDEIQQAHAEYGAMIVLSKEISVLLDMPRSDFAQEAEAVRNELETTYEQNVLSSDSQSRMIQNKIVELAQMTQPLIKIQEILKMSDLSFANGIGQITTDWYAIGLYCFNLRQNFNPSFIKYHYEFIQRWQEILGKIQKENSKVDVVNSENRKKVVDLISEEYKKLIKSLHSKSP